MALTDVTRFEPPALDGAQAPGATLDDLKAAIDGARRDGFAAGREEGYANGQKDGHAAGLTDGRAEARAETAKAAADNVAALARAIADAASARADGLRREREALARYAADVVEAFCAGLNAARERELALALIDELIAADATPTTLRLAPTAVERLGGDVRAACETRGVAVILAADPNLAAGEARLDWRGGEIRRTRTEINAAVDALVRRAAAERANDRTTQEEGAHERAE
ncbi:MAG: hypothetical protein ACFB00_03365 [Parvularculaceae bacterium]